MDSAHFPEDGRHGNGRRDGNRSSTHSKDTGLPDDDRSTRHPTRRYTRIHTRYIRRSCSTCQTRYNHYNWYYHHRRYTRYIRNTRHPKFCNPISDYPNLHNPTSGYPDHLSALTATIKQTEILTQILTTIRTPITPEPPIVSMSAFMPRPGQPGSLDVFNGENISDYLESFNAECELYGVKADQHAARFPHYCNTEVKDIVTLLGGYESRDWNQLQVEMKKFYWQNDHPKNTFTALNALIRRSRDLTLSAFVLKFTAITNVLVTNGVMSAADRVIRLLEGLNEGMRIKVIKLCTQKGWRITDQDSGESPNFDEIKKFLDDEAKTNERFAVYARDHTM